MTVIKNNNTVFFDVDETLVLTLEPTTENASHIFIDIPDPLNPNGMIVKALHIPMIRLLQEEHAKGSFVVVWSRGGYDWATSVVRALKLETKVNLVMTKPMVYFDDLPIEKWLPYRVYFEPGTKYK